jgi:hypothetical protein
MHGVLDAKLDVLDAMHDVLGAKFGVFDTFGQ